MASEGADMIARSKQSKGPPPRPEPPWIPAAMLGLSINALAAGVIAFSVGMALGKAITRIDP